MYCPVDQYSGGAGWGFANRPIDGAPSRANLSRELDRLCLRRRGADGRNRGLAALRHLDEQLADVASGEHLDHRRTKAADAALDLMIRH